MVVPRRTWPALLLAGVLALGAGMARGQSGAGSAARAPASAQPDRGSARSPAGPSGSAEASEPEPQTPSVTPGYSWTDKPRKRRVRRRRIKYDPNAPHVTFPGFRMLPDGSSLIWVVVDKKTSVEVHRAQGQVTYVLTGAAVHTRNNTYPLVTTHFNTPVSRLRLVPRDAGAHLVVELREAVQPVHQVIDGPRGMMVLQVRLPRASRQYAAARPLAPLGVGRTLPPAQRGGGRTGSQR
jgi:hypothetical protein